ncbi:MAG: MATE family efflux transporter [Oscillospiraceae bacterium]|jgi:putative MATE family efflux protein|nr:MATE family efflux transporter [Oscillospiraceae bacterium]
MENTKIDTEKLKMFESMPVPKAVMKNAVPSIIGMIMVMVYNMADTFFIAQTHSDLQVAAVSLATPLFMVFMGLGNLFGAGGTSVISRALGAERSEYASKVSAFCMWSCVACGTALMLALWLFMTPLLRLIGASAETESLARSYLSIVAICGPFIMFSSCFSTIIRAEGKAASAMTGMLIGNIANILLDPLLILAFGWGIAGAAIATVVGNLAASAFYLLYFFRKKSTLSISPKHFTVRDNVLTSVFAIGLPASLGNLLMSASHIFVNGMMAGYGDLAVAAMGVAMKMPMLVGTMCIGLGQGAQPLLGYCVGGQLWRRYKEIFRFSMICAAAFGIALTGICYLFADNIVGAFLTEAETFRYGVRFAKIIMCTGAQFGVFYLITSALQAMGSAIPTFVISLSRQGLVYIPTLVILNTLLGINGLVWAQPVADILSLILAIVMYRTVIRRKMYADA